MVLSPCALYGPCYHSPGHSRPTLPLPQRGLGVRHRRLLTADPAQPRPATAGTPAHLWAGVPLQLLDVHPWWHLLDPHLFLDAFVSQPGYSPPAPTPLPSSLWAFLFLSLKMFLIGEKNGRRERCGRRKGGQLLWFDLECSPAFQAAPLSHLFIFDAQTGPDQMKHTFQGQGWGSGFTEASPLRLSPSLTPPCPGLP